MHTDKYGLPTQADGDANDQLQRCGMIVTAYWLDPSNNMDFSRHVWNMIHNSLQVSPGIYTRYIGGRTDTVSADQLISVLAAMSAAKSRKGVYDLFKAMIKRFGFAQNTKDGLNGTFKSKTPDFMFFRALPLLYRRPWLYPIGLFADALLLILAMQAVGPVWEDGKGFRKRTPNDVDDNDTILTLAVCRCICPTPFSYLAIKLYSKLRPWNRGCIGPMYEPNWYHPVYGALRYYHRAEAGGNIEIAEMWKPIIERYFR